MSIRIPASGLAILALSIFASLPALAQNPVPQLFPQSQGQLCFVRQYDAAHLKKLPGQKVTRILASVVKEKPSSEGVWLRMRLQLRGENRPVDVAAGCSWDERANVDTAGKRVFSTYRKNEGFVCIATFTRESAEEAGPVLFDIPADGKALLLHLDDEIGLWVETNPDKKRKRLKLGKDDRVFRLDRTGDSECSALIDQVRID